MTERLPSDERNCECRRLERYAADPMFPIEFDSATNEFHIVHDGARISMKYCFRCGGRLPESARASLFTTPDENEMAEVEDLLRDARTINDVTRILGPPDARHESTRQFDYRERWPSLTLFVHEHPGGTVSYLIGGKQLSAEQ